MNAEQTHISYGDWNLPYEKLMRPFTTEEAQAHDALGKEYWVLFGSPTRPSQVIRVSDERVNYLVAWLDEQLREIMSYLFVPVDKNRRGDLTQSLFLEQVHFREYDTPDIHSALPSRAGTTYFEHDGSAFHVQDIGNGREKAETPPMPPAEARQLLFEPHPAFGDWTSIARRDRDHPASG